MKQYLIDKKEELRQLKVVPRDIELFETKLGLAIIGPRRAGKTFLLIDTINKKRLHDEEYVFINFEDDILVHMKREEKVNFIRDHIEIYNHEPKYLFLDEIYALEDWQSFLYSLIESHKYYIFITGSSSKLLSREIATQLRGRAFTKIVYPFSFKEYLRVINFNYDFKFLSTTKKSMLLHHLFNYLSNTGFGSVLIDNVPPNVFFKDYLDLVIFKDVMERYKLENIFALRYILLKMISSFTKQFSINKIYNELKSRGIRISKDTLYDYSQYILDSFVVFFIKRFGFSEKVSEFSIPKVYLCDNGLANYLLRVNTNTNIGKLMENVVAVELKKREFEFNVNIFYWRDYQHNEVDFVVKDGVQVSQLIQVTYSSSRDEISKREINSLLKASNELKCNDLLIITWDYKAKEHVNGKLIKFVPLYEWLLSEI